MSTTDHELPNSSLSDINTEIDLFVQLPPELKLKIFEHLDFQTLLNIYISLTFLKQSKSRDSKSDGVDNDFDSSKVIKSLTILDIDEILKFCDEHLRKKFYSGFKVMSFQDSFFLLTPASLLACGKNTDGQLGVAHKNNIHKLPAK